MTMASQLSELEETTTTREHRHLFILLNGKKSGDKHLREAVKHLRYASEDLIRDSTISAVIRPCKSFRMEGHEVDVRVTWESADAHRYIEEALARTSVTTIVAAGGDGTVNEVPCSW